MSGAADGGASSPSSGVLASVIRRANALREATASARPGTSPVAATTWGAKVVGSRVDIGMSIRLPTLFLPRIRLPTPLLFGVG
jgi:hypothetical protein